MTCAYCDTEHIAVALETSQGLMCGHCFQTCGAKWQIRLLFLRLCRKDGEEPEDGPPEAA